MKTLSLILLVCAASSAFALDKVAITVNVKTDGRAVSEAKGKEEEQRRFLDITLTNRTREELSGLVVKWAIFATDLAEGGTTKAGSGEIKSSVYPQRGETLQSQTVTMNYTPRHAERASKGKGGYGNRRRGNTTYKTVEATGNRYKGWGVQVYQGTALIGEAYSTPELKNSMGSR
jgi:hypothetical protein